MNRLFFLVVCPILLTTFGEFILKNTVNSLTIDLSIYSLFAVFINPQLFLGIGCILCGGILWLIAMSKYSLSFMYPFMSLNYLLVVVGANFILGESVGFNRYLAAVFIILGLIIISRSENTEN